VEGFRILYLATTHCAPEFHRNLQWLDASGVTQSFLEQTCRRRSSICRKTPCEQEGFRVEGDLFKQGRLIFGERKERVGAVVSGVWRVIVGEKELDGGLMMKIQWLAAPHWE